MGQLHLLKYRLLYNHEFFLNFCNTLSLVIIMQIQGVLSLSLKLLKILLDPTNEQVLMDHCMNF